VNDKEWDSLGNVLAFVLLLCILFVLLAVVASVHGQTVTAIKVDMPMPPDLLSIERPSCNLDEYEAEEVLDAKTGEVTTITRWRVEPFATYKDHRPKWALPEEVLPHGTRRVPGSIADLSTSHEAIDACLAWTREVKKAIAREHARQHPVKK